MITELSRNSVEEANVKPRVSKLFYDYIEETRIELRNTLNLKRDPSFALITLLFVRNYKIQQIKEDIIKELNIEKIEDLKRK